MTTLESDVPKQQFVGLHFNDLTWKISNRLKKYGINVGFSCQNILKSKLPNLKDSIDKNVKSGVYKITCGDCDHVYIGQTQRSFNTRFKEHLKRQEISNFCNHLLQHNHNPKNAKLDILSTDNNYT